MARRVDLGSVVGPPGPEGDPGRGISSVSMEFYLSNSKTSQIGGSWTTSMPQWSKGKYLWTRYKIVYSNPSGTSYTAPTCDSTWEAVDDLEIGGKNLILDSAFPVSTEKWNLRTGYSIVTDVSPFPGRCNSIRCVNQNAKRLDVPGEFFAPYMLGRSLTLTFWIMCPDISKITTGINAWIGYRNAGYDAVGNNPLVITKDDFEQGGGNNAWIKFMIQGRRTTEGSDYCTFMFQPNNVQATFYIAAPKLEYGNVPTDWSPAPEDVEAESGTKIYAQASAPSGVASGTVWIDT